MSATQLLDLKVSSVLYRVLKVNNDLILNKDPAVILYLKTIAAITGDTRTYLYIQISYYIK